MATSSRTLDAPRPITQPLSAPSATALVRQKWLVGLSLICSDAMMLAAAFSLAFWIRFDLRVALSPGVEASPDFYLQLGCVLIPVWIAIFAVYGLYDYENVLGGTIEYSRAFHACTVGMMVPVVAAFVEPAFVVARGWLLTSWVLSVVFVCSGRFAIRRVVYSMRRRGVGLTPVVIVGGNGEALSLARQLAEHGSAGYKVLGLVTSRLGAPGDSDVKGATSLPTLGSVRDIASVIRTSGAQELIVAASSLERGELLDLFEQVQELQGLKIRMSTGLYEVLTTGVQVKTAGVVPLISLNRLRLGFFETVVKTAMEYSFTVLGLVLLLPLLALISLLIKLDSRGPVIYRRRVLGVGGKEFDAFKFRTMYVDADELLDQEPGARQRLESEGKLKSDPRITPVGRWLRRYSLDELPQLVNVLLGQMSLVGPRIITAGELVRYGKQKLNLLTVKPGITGLWQVSGRSDLSYQERVRLDMHYIRNYSLWLDLQILFVQTPAAVWSGKGAY